MDVDKKFFQFLTQAESKENFVYPDSRNLPTIGIGHLLTSSELSSGKINIAGRLVKYHKGLTDEEVEMLCRQDADKAVRAVNMNVHVPMTQNQFNALVSFTFNVGIQAFKNSTLLRRLNVGSYSSVPHEMRRWVHASGMVVQGLINRREAEVKLWESK